MKRFVLLSFILIALGLCSQVVGQSNNITWAGVIRQQIRHSHCDSCGFMIHSMVHVSYSGDRPWKHNFSPALQQLTFESYYDAHDTTVLRRGDTLFFFNPANRYYTHFLPCPELFLEDAIVVQHQKGYLILNKNSGKIILQKTFVTPQPHYQLREIDIRQTGQDTTTLLSAGLTRFVGATTHYVFVCNGPEIFVIDRKRWKEVSRIQVKFKQASPFKLSFSARRRNFSLFITASRPRD